MDIGGTKNKNNWLRSERGFSFEAIVEAIEDADLLADVLNPSENHPSQRMLVVALDGYAVTVPYVEEIDRNFLKTAFKSRKANKQYLLD